MKKKAQFQWHAQPRFKNYPSYLETGQSYHTVTAKNSKMLRLIWVKFTLVKTYPLSLHSLHERKWKLPPYYMTAEGIYSIQWILRNCKCSNYKEKELYPNSHFICKINRRISTDIPHTATHACLSPFLSGQQVLLWTNQHTNLLLNGCNLSVT